MGRYLSSYSKGQRVRERMLNITSHQGSSSQKMTSQSTCGHYTHTKESCVGENVESLTQYGLKRKRIQLLPKSILGLLKKKKSKIELPYGPEILSTYLKELKLESTRGICTVMFVTALFTIAEKQTQHNACIRSKCSGVHWWDPLSYKREQNAHPCAPDGSRDGRRTRLLYSTLHTPRCVKSVRWRTDSWWGKEVGLQLLSISCRA